MSGNVLILGATGRFGRSAAEAFWNAGWRVTPFDRATGDLTTAARGQDVIVNGWNPPYARWQADLPGLTAQAIAAARVSDALLVLPGNVYVYGADAPARLAPQTPHAATNPLGRARIAMERALKKSGVGTLILRAGDFIDTAPSGNWFDRVMTARLGQGKFVYPGDPCVDHAFAFLPDLAAALVGLCERRATLARFEDVPFPGYTITGHDLAQGLQAATGRPVRLSRMNWLPVTLTAPVWPMARHLREMRYLWNKAHHLDGSRFDALLPGFRATPLGAALRLAIQRDVDPDQPVTRRNHVAVAQ